MDQSILPTNNLTSGNSTTAGAINITTWLGQAVQSLNAINKTLSNGLPQATGTAPTATGGSVTLPASPVGFLEIYSPSLGATVKVPYYNT